MGRFAKLSLIIVGGKEGTTDGKISNECIQLKLEKVGIYLAGI